MEVSGVDPGQRKGKTALTLFEIQNFEYKLKFQQQKIRRLKVKYCA